jgi:hypothetical protein
MHKLLACTTFAIAGITLAEPVFASERKPERVCKVGNGKAATYHDDVARCTLARAQGKQVEMLPPSTAATPAPKPATAPTSRRARRGSPR